MIEPTGPESQPSASAPATGRPRASAMVALVLVAAIASGAVAAGVTIGILRFQARTNPQQVDLGSRVTISVDTAATQVALKDLPAVISIVTSEVAPTVSSGFMVTTDGFVVTNTEVLKGATTLTVVIPSDNRRHDARIVDFDCQTGLAVLKVDQVSGLPTLAFADSGSLRVGQEVVALGGPLETRVVVAPGVASALHRSLQIANPLSPGSDVQLDDTIQTDAPMVAGDSGGPLLNVAGQVVGISVVAVDGGQQIGFALASNDVQPELQQIITTGRLVVPTLQAETVEVSPQDAVLKGLLPGSLVRSVVAGGPADVAGIRAGDVITQLDEVHLDAAHPLAQVLRARFKPSQRITVTYARGSSSTQVQLTLRGDHPKCS